MLTAYDDGFSTERLMLPELLSTGNSGKGVIEAEGKWNSVLGRMHG